jgi:ParB/RepB/Spo0J family partition protein
LEPIKESSLKIVDIHVDSLVPYEDNVNEMDDATFERLIEEIQENGFINPIQVIPMDDGRYKIMGGHHRWQAAKKIGIDYIPAVILTDEKWKQEDLFDLASFRLNAIHGKMNSEKFVKVYEKMSAKYGKEKLSHLFAVTDNEVWEKLTSGVRKSMQDAGIPKEIVDKFKKSEKKMKNVNDMAEVLNQLFAEHGSTIDSNFVFFKFGNKEHVMIMSNIVTYRAIQIISTAALDEKKDINEYISQPLRSVAEKIALRDSKS